MPDQPAPRQVRPRVDDTAADTGTLVDMGVMPEQPEPPPPDPPVEPPVEPEPDPAPEPDPETSPDEPPPDDEPE